MRYDTRISFIAEVQGAYDDATGNYGTATLTTVVAYANIIEAIPQDRTNWKYGSKRQGTLHAHLQNALRGILPQYAVIEGKRYDILETRYAGTYYLLGGEVV
jgi:hypothetical protein